MRQHFKIAGPDAVQNIGFAAHESSDLRIFRRYESKFEPVEVGQTISSSVGFPIIRILLQNDLLAGHVFFQPKRPHPSDSAWSDVKSPSLGEFSITPWLLQQVARQDCQAVEDAFGGGVGLGQTEPDSPRIDLLHADGLAADNQQITLRRMHAFVQVHLEGEDDIVRVHRMTVGKAQPSPELKDEFTAIARSRPRFGQTWVGLETAPIDRNQSRPSFAGSHRATEHPRP